jgi:hypothetical protein
MSVVEQWVSRPVSAAAAIGSHWCARDSFIFALFVRGAGGCSEQAFAGGERSLQFTTERYIAT